jgi:hypothetical protein
MAAPQKSWMTTKPFNIGDAQDYIERHDIHTFMGTLLRCAANAPLPACGSSTSHRAFRFVTPPT